MDLYPHTYALRAAITQRLTRWPGHPVTRYGSTNQIAVAPTRLHYRTDTVNHLAESAGFPLPPGPLKDLAGRKFDFLRHVSQSQRNMDWLDDAGSPPPEGMKLTAGDCDDFSAYWAAALLAGGLAVEVRLVCVVWQPATGEPVAHMLAEWDDDGGHTWSASNWFQCEARPATAAEVMGFYLRRPLTYVTRWRITLAPGDRLRLWPVP